MMQGLAAPKMPPLMQMWRSFTPWLCVTGGESRQSGHKFWGSANNSNRYLVSARWVPRMLTDDQKRSRLDISRYLLSQYEDDSGDCIDRVVIQYET